MELKPAVRRFASAHADHLPLVADHYAPPEGAPGGKGTVVIIHGYCEHRGRYRHVGGHLAGAGFHVLCPDLRGHGESGGTRAYVERFADYLGDVQAALAEARAAIPNGGDPVLLGHSMGGLVATRYAQEGRDRLRALVLSSPFFGFKLKVPVWKRALGQVASRLYPALAIPSELDPGELSHDPAVAAAYAADPLVSRVATARWFTEAQAAQAEVLRRAPRLDVPTLLMHGGDDRIADPAASQAVFDRLGAKDKMLTLYPGLFHEIFNEVERGRVLADMVTWLEAR